MLFSGARSIQSKLMITISLTLFVTLTLAGIALISFDRQTAKQQLMDDIVTVTAITSKRSAAAVAFQDTEALAGNLEALRGHPRISMACVYLSDKSLLAQFQRDSHRQCPPLSRTDKQQTFLATALRVQAPIMLANRLIGVLLLEAELSHLNARLLKYSAVTLALLLASGLLGILFTRSLHRQLTSPLQQLAHLAKRVRTDNDFSLRARKASNDETGELVTSFNSMLHHIQETHWQLEDAVEELRAQKQASEQKAVSETVRANDIRTFFAGASHDLKQPLNAMRLFLEALEQQPLDTPARQLAHKLAQANQNLSALFSSLLDAEKFEHKMQQVELQPLDLGALLHKLAHEFEPLATDKALSLRVRAPECILRSDPAMLERIVRNLLSNAIRYTKNGGILMAWRHRTNAFVVDVWDTGCGIPPDKLNTVFEQYVQLNNPLHETQKGFGLGLSIVRRLSESLGYSITVKSRVGRGTLFRITLPDLPPPPATQLVSTVENPLKDKRILIVDDDTLSLEALDHLLHAWGMEIALATSLPEALESIQEYGFYPDVLLSDYHLDAEDASDQATGVQVMTAVRHALGVDIPTLIMSGDPYLPSTMSFNSSGLPLLTKPIDSDALKQQLLRIFVCIKD